MNRSGDLVAESARNDGKIARMQDLLAIIDGHNKNPPRGREIHFRRHLNNMSPRFKTATILDIKGVDGWNDLIEAGLRFDRFHSFVDHRDGVQIGPLYISCHELTDRGFQTVFGLSQSNEWLWIAILSNQAEEKHAIRQCEATLKGFIRWYTSTDTKTKTRESFVQSWESLPWPFLFNWDVTLDTIRYSYCDQNEIGTSLLQWISGHCRDILIYCLEGIPTESDFRSLLVNEASKIEHIGVSNSTENLHLTSLSAALQQSTTIKSLSINFAKCSRHEVVEAACACNSLRKISIHSTRPVSMDGWMHDVVPLVECNRFEDVRYIIDADRQDELNSLSEDEQEHLQLDRTQTILNAIQGNARILKLDLICPWNIGGPFVDHDLIKTILGSRRDARKMSRILETDSPTKMAIFGEWITRICTCRYAAYCDKQKQKMIRTSLFTVLCETNEHVVRLVSSGCSQRKRNRSNFEADGPLEQG